MQYRNSSWDLCSAGTITFRYYSFHPVTLEEESACLSNSGYESVYSRGITAKADGGAFMTGCSTEKARRLFFYDYTIMLGVNDNRLPRWKRCFFFTFGKSLSQNHALLVIYIQSPPPNLYLQGLTALTYVPNSPKRPAEAWHIGQFRANSWQPHCEEARRWLASSLVVNWKPCSRARSLPEIPIDRNAAAGGGSSGVHMPQSMTAIFYSAGGQSPWWPRPREWNYSYLHAREQRGEACWARRTPRRKRPLLEKSMLMTGECCHTQANTHPSVLVCVHKCKGHVM